MDETPPLLSPMLPMQLILRGARALGYGAPALRAVIERMTSRNHKAEVFAGYQPQAHDVFVTCFSKSGTNWAMQLAVQVAHRGAAEFQHIHKIVPWPEGKFTGIVPLDDPAPRQAAPTGLRGIKTAFEADYVPYDPAAKYLCVARDPKEVAVSAYYFLTGVFGLRRHVSPDEWFEMTTAPGGFMRTWPGHMASYWAWRERPNVRVLFYADMKRDLPGTVDAVAELLEVELDEAERAEVVRKCGFEYMKAHESCFAPPRLPLLTGKARGQMLRQGQSGKSSEMLSAEQRATLDRLMLADLEALGSDFPYAERFMDDVPAGAEGPRPDTP